MNQLPAPGDIVTYPDNNNRPKFGKVIRIEGASNVLVAPMRSGGITKQFHQRADAVVWDIDHPVWTDRALLRF